MPRQTLSLLLTLALLVAACAPSGEKTAGSHTTTSSTTTSTSTTTTQATTTTTAPLVLENAPAVLSALIDDFYKYAYGEITSPPAMPEAVIASIAPSPGQRPDTGVTTQGVFKETTLATVWVGEDLFLVINDGEWRIVGGSWPSVGAPAYFGDGPRHIAVVGSDARPGQDVDGSRADSIHFVALDGSGSGAIVGLPRDSYIPVPGYGTRKITGSLALGGPEVMMEAFRNLTGLPFEGYVLTGFSGFQYLIDRVLGGVEVDVPFAINDSAAKAVLSAGLQVLDGFDALAFSRARKTLPGGDFDRSEHQGLVLIAAARGAKSMGFDALPLLLEEAEQYLQTNLTPEQIFTFSAMVLNSNLDEIPNLVASGSPGSAGGASVVYLHDSAYSTFEDLADGALGN